MQITYMPGRIWTVHQNNTIISQWTSRDEAREIKRTLRSRGQDNITIGYYDVNYGTYTVDNKS